jgi:hypothetical protein
LATLGAGFDQRTHQRSWECRDRIEALKSLVRGAHKFALEDDRRTSNPKADDLMLFTKRSQFRAFQGALAPDKILRKSQ